MKKYLIFFFAFLFVHTVQAQHPIDQAIKLMESENYAEALPLLDEGLYSAQIDPKLQAKGYLHRAICHLQLEAKEDFLLQATYDLTKARNSGSEWAKQAKSALEDLQPRLQDSAQLYFNQIFLPETSKAATGRLATKARKYFDGLLLVNPSFYRPYFYRGYCAQMMVDPLNAVRDYQQCIQFYQGNRPAIPDTIIIHVFSQCAETQFNYLQKTAEALSFLEVGIAFLSEEKNRCHEIEKKDPSKNMDLLISDFEEGIKALESQITEIKGQQNHLSEAQIQAFENALKADPNNTNLWIAYGTLYEPIDSAKAEEYFLNALKLKPKDANLLNRLLQLATNLGDAEKQAAYQDAIDQLNE